MLHGLVTDVVERVRKYKETHKPNFDRSMSKGLYFLQDKRPDIAEYEFRDAISLNPTSSVAWYFFAHSVQKQHDLGIEKLNDKSLEELIGAYHRVIELEPSAENYYNVAIAFHSLGLHSNEQFLMYKAVKANPDWELLTRIGLYAKTLESIHLLDMVNKELRHRSLTIHLYPYTIASKQ